MSSRPTGYHYMSEDHVGNLQKLRAKLLEYRREAAAELIRAQGPREAAQPDYFMATQAAIEAVDRALEDEKRAATKGQYSRESR